MTDLSISAAMSADVRRRTITGTVYRYGEVGQTTAGPLRVSPALAPPPVGLPLTLEHDRSVTRGHVAMVDNTAERLRIAVRVVDGPIGDAALAEAVDRTRAGFSFDLEETQVVNGVILGGRWAAVGQVETPAFNSARIDQVAASAASPAPTERPARAWWSTPVQQLHRVAASGDPTTWPR